MNQKSKLKIQNSKTQLISGFNTDIENEGVTYHVQTEDKGLETPFVLSLVYAGGEILAAKRSPYDDLIKSGFAEEVLTERLQRQHRLICAAVKQGRIEDLKRMSMREPAAVVEKVAAPQNKPPIINIEPELLDLEPLDLEPLLEIPIALIDSGENGLNLTPQPPIDVNSHSVRVLRTEFDAPIADFARAESVPTDALSMILLDEREFRGGDRVALRIQVTHGSADENIVGAEIVVKVLGAAFRPVIFHAKTIASGIAVVQMQFPHFKTGRAALLIKATHGGYEAELRRIVTQG